MDKIKLVEEREKRTDIPEIRPGDTVTVNYRVIEGNRERIQPFKGTVIAVKSSGPRRTITVRKVSFGVGVERIIPLHSPQVESIKVERKGKVRRAKLYYLRERTGKATRIKEKR